jgi:phage protein D
VEFKDWGVDYEVITPGTPVEMILSSVYDKRMFYGYVHDIRPEKTPGSNFATVTFIGGSFPMKQQYQAVYTNVTADQVIKQIASNYNFACYAEATQRLYPQISQAGHSDWEFMVRLAKQNGYTLRTENTELYFQPIMKDYTDLRSEAPKFVMRHANHPEGSTIYSFMPVVSESLTWAEGTKAATAVNGVDLNSGVNVSVTQQIRNKKIRKKQQIEFFDRYATDTVALNPQVAQYEAEAIENRNYFPYRAQVEVLGHATLRPDLPVYLQGVGSPYEGYWVILEVEHRIVEESANTFKYTTCLTVGADSLGSAVAWTDSQTVNIPDALSKRTIIPNVKQTKVKPKTGLLTPARIVTPQLKGSFGTIENRAKPSTTSRVPGPSTWRTQTPSLSNIIPTPKKPPAIVQRLASKRGL